MITALGAFKAALKLQDVITHAGTVPPLLPLLPLLPAEIDQIAAITGGAGIPAPGGK